MVGSIRLGKVATDSPQKVKAIVWCNERNRFTLGKPGHRLELTY